MSGHHKPGVYLGEVNRAAAAAAFEHDPSAPGKFEGEPTETVYYYHCMVDGYGYGPEHYPIFKITDGERRLFPDLTDAIHYLIHTLDDGFITGWAE